MIQCFSTINLAAGGDFIVQDSSGAPLGEIDSTGTMDIKGIITQNSEPTAGAKDFVIQNSTGGLFLTGSLTQNVLFS